MLWSKTFVFFTVEFITVIHTLDSFGHDSWATIMGSRWRPITTSSFVRHLENVQIKLFVFLHSRLTIFQRWHSRNITSMNLYRCFASQAFINHCWIVGKPVSWTLDADQPRKTGSRYNDTLNGARKPKGSVTMSRKLTVLIHCLVGDFRLKLHWGVKIPPRCRDKG